MFLLCFITILPFAVIALPVTNDPGTAVNEALLIPKTVGWYSPPQVRGTLGLLLSCLTTLSLCAWTAYHPNVHGGRSQWSRVGHRTTWMLITIFVPEVVLFCAWQQWWAARKLQAGVDGYGETAFDESASRERDEGFGLDILFADDVETMRMDEKPEQMSVGEKKSKWGWRTKDKKQKIVLEEKKYTWDMGQSFFALSGGYAVPSPFPNSPPLALTLAGLLVLARLGLLPRTSSSTVSDKSKADFLAKILVCIQAGWFLIQCIARAVKHLPVTVLEVHVLAHVLCAFIMYAIWIDKPYDVGSPIEIEGERARDLGALWGSANGSADKNAGHMKKSSSIPQSLSVSEIAPAYRRPVRPSSTLRYLKQVVEHFEDMFERQLVHFKEKHSEAEVGLEGSPELLEHLERASRALSYLHERGVEIIYKSRAFPLSSSEGVSSLKYGDGIHYPMPYVVATRSDLIIDGMGSYRNDRTRDHFLGLRTKTFAFFSICYGTLHLLAWSRSHFPTDVEAWLWRGAALVMIAAPTLIVVAETLRWLCAPLEPVESSRMWKHVVSDMNDVFWAILIALGMMLWCLYPVARLYVLCESFASLRAIPGDVYRTVEWSTLIPHAG